MAERLSAGQIEELLDGTKRPDKYGMREYEKDQRVKAGRDAVVKVIRDAYTEADESVYLRQVLSEKVERIVRLEVEIDELRARLAHQEAGAAPDDAAPGGVS